MATARSRRIFGTAIEGALGADVVVFAVYAGNDVADLVYGSVDSAVIEQDAGLVGPIRTPLVWLFLHSEIVRRSKAALGTLSAHGGTPSAPGPLVPLAPLIRVLRECHGCWFQSLKQGVRARVDPDRLDQAYGR